MWKKLLSLFSATANEQLVTDVRPIIQVNPESVGKAVLIYMVEWFKADQANFLFGPYVGSEHKFRSGQYSLPKEDFINAVRGRWGGNVPNPHVTVVVEILRPGDRSTVVLIGDQKITISNQDLFNGVTDIETHQMLFSNELAFVHEGSRRNIRDLNTFYYGTAGHWFQTLTERAQEVKETMAAREEVVRQMARNL